MGLRAAGWATRGLILYESVAGPSRGSSLAAQRATDPAFLEVLRVAESVMRRDGSGIAPPRRFAQEFGERLRPTQFDEIGNQRHALGVERRDRSLVRKALAFQERADGEELAILEQAGDCPAITRDPFG